MKREPQFVALAALLAGAAHALGFARVRLDDAYITFRYGENLARGRGFVFNEGEHLLGTTSPGHALVAAAVHGLVGHAALPAVMSALGALAWTAQAWLVYALMRRALGGFVASGAALGIALGAARSYMFVPLETNLVAALTLGALVLAVRERWSLAGLALGAAIVVRADAGLAVVPIAILAALSLRERRAGGRIAEAWRPMVALAAPPLAWGAFARAYFGTVLPHTLHAKVHASTLLTYATTIAKLPVAILPVSNGGDSLAGGVALWGVAIAGWALALTRDRRIGVVPAWGALHAAAYLVLRPDVAFEWHLYPLALVAAIGALVALAWTLSRLPRTARVAALLVAAGLASWNLAAFFRECPDLYWFGARDAMHREVASYLRAHARPGDVVDSEEVGTIAYWADLPMIDHRGLVTPFELSEIAESPGESPEAHHCRVLAALPRLRFVVMNRFELGAHRCLFGATPLVPFSRAAIHDFERPPLLGKWALWVADRDEAVR